LSEGANVSAGWRRLFPNAKDERVFNDQPEFVEMLPKIQASGQATKNGNPKLVDEAAGFMYVLNKPFTDKKTGKQKQTISRYPLRKGEQA
jgi:hypothetical protein